MPVRRELPEQIVDLTSPGWNSRLGRYYIGQTEELQFGHQYCAWGGILNPYHSDINLYFDIFTVTNFKETSFTAEIWLNMPPPAGASYVPVIAANQSVIPMKRPKAYMLQADYLEEDLSGGVNIFGRIVPPNSTLVSDSHQGSIVIGPGGTFSILLKATEYSIVTATIVLTWWEENIRRGQ